MGLARPPRTVRIILSLIVVCFIVVPVQAQYSGGSGTADDPYQIATAEDLIALGEMPDDYDKYFILTADIDLDPNLPGRKVFDRAVIAPDVNDVEDDFQGTTFAGVFDGKDHIISHLTIEGENSVGLFGQLGPGAEISNLGLAAVDVNGSGYPVGGLAGSLGDWDTRGGILTNCYCAGRVTGDRCVGGLVGYADGDITSSYNIGTAIGSVVSGGLVGHNSGSITSCHSAGSVSGDAAVGGLVGTNDKGTISLSYSTCSVTGERRWVGGLVGSSANLGNISSSYSTGSVSGNESVGGLVGYVGPSEGSIATSYSTGSVSGNDYVGGLVGNNGGSIITSYSTGTISGNEDVGGLVGYNGGSIVTSYSASTVNGSEIVGGLVGSNGGSLTMSYSTGGVSGDQQVGGLVGYNSQYSVRVSSSFWDMETSGQATSAGGMGLTTPEMRDVNTFLSAGWDFAGEVLNGTCDYWQIPQGDYPRLQYNVDHGPVMPEGLGTAEQPYLIRDVRDLGTVWFKPLAYYRLETPLDLSETTWSLAVVPWFNGTFDGKGHVIGNLRIEGDGFLGLFGQAGPEAQISDLGLEAVNVSGASGSVGGLMGHNLGTVVQCYSIGEVAGGASYNYGGMFQYGVGGMVGANEGTLIWCHSSGIVNGTSAAGGIAGWNSGSIKYSYSHATVTGEWAIGGLVGNNGCYDFGELGLPVGEIFYCYSAGHVFGDEGAGGLVGAAWYSDVGLSFWDIQTSGQETSEGGLGLQTVEMQDPDVLRGLGWDFVGPLDGPHDVWAVPEGGGYPVLWWELSPLASLPSFSGGTGEADDPYLIATSEDLTGIGHNHRLMSSHFKLIRDIDLTDTDLHPIGNSDFPYEGVFDGNGYTISHLTIEGEGPLGLFAVLASGAQVKDLGVVDVNIACTGNEVGGLVGRCDGAVSRCHSTGTVAGEYRAGGLVGDNYGSVTACCSTAAVSGQYVVGGLIGSNSGLVDQCLSAGSSIGPYSNDARVGGLAGQNWYGTLSRSYSTATVSGGERVGGLAGLINWDSVVYHCYSAGVVSGGRRQVGGLIGSGSSDGEVIDSFWDILASSLSESSGGTGLTTAEMQTAGTFLEAGWDFLDETENGTDDIWWILEGQDYPRLWWEPRN